MPLVLPDRVLETSTTTGTGTYTLAGAVTGFQSFSAVGNANTCQYVAYEVDGNGNPSGGWEVGLGTYTSSGTTLARTTIYASSNSGAAVSWSAGTRRIGVTRTAAGTHVVLQPGGTAGTDEVQISHDGTNGFIRPMSGSLHFGRASDGFVMFKLNEGGQETLGSFDMNGGSITEAGIIYFGAGANDTTLSRAAANVLTTGTGWLQNGAGTSRVNSDLTNATTTLASVTGLSATVIAGRKYTSGRIKLWVENVTAADGLKLDLDGGTATWTSFRATYVIYDTSAAGPLASGSVTAIATDITAATVTGAAWVEIEFAGVCNAGGTFIPRYAKNSDAAGATLTLRANSFMSMEDCP